ncbi:MAG: hypothetical protein ABUT39_18970 [Acidobacteriota bacterium]
MRSRVALVLLAVLALLGSARAGAERGPSTPKERAKALKLIRQLEEDPRFEGSVDARRWLSLWLVQVPDLNVDLCPALLGGTPAERKRLPGEVVGQLLYSGAAFLMEHKDGSREQVYLAGLTGALKVYEALLKEKPHVRSPLLDSLIGRRDAGTLVAHVAETLSSCPPPGLKTR